MGMRNVSGVRKVVRGGKPRWFVDLSIPWAKDGVRRRFRRLARQRPKTTLRLLRKAARLMRRAA